jgi:hypothetical protein
MIKKSAMLQRHGSEVFGKVNIAVAKFSSNFFEF